MSIFNKNKRRDKTTYLDMEDGKVVTSEVNIVKNLNARDFDDFTDEELQDDVDTYTPTPINTNIEIKNGLPVCEPIMENTEEEYEEEDETVSDMKATIFNILKFVCIFGMVAAFGWLCLKTLPKTVGNVTNAGTSNQSNITNNVNQFNNNVNIFENVQTNKTKDKMKNSMNYMNAMNNQLKNSYLLTQKYCLEYYRNKNTLYAHEKNMDTLSDAIKTDFINFLNTESSFVQDFDKELFELYKLRYQNLSDCMAVLKNTKNYNRTSILNELNKFILIDNKYNKQEFEVLINYFNKHNLSYTITENSIILND